jgi:hypothetical protein
MSDKQNPPYGDQKDPREKRVIKAVNPAVSVPLTINLQNDETVSGTCVLNLDKVSGDVRPDPEEGGLKNLTFFKIFTFVLSLEDGRPTFHQTQRASEEVSGEGRAVQVVNVTATPLLAVNKLILQFVTKMPASWEYRDLSETLIGMAQLSVMGMQEISLGAGADQTIDQIPDLEDRFLEGVEASMDCSMDMDIDPQATGVTRDNPSFTLIVDDEDGWELYGTGFPEDVMDVNDITEDND